MMDDAECCSVARCSQRAWRKYFPAAWRMWLPQNSLPHLPKAWHCHDLVFFNCLQIAFSPILSVLEVEPLVLWFQLLTPLSILDLTLFLSFPIMVLQLFLSNFILSHLMFLHLLGCVEWGNVSWFHTQSGGCIKKLLVASENSHLKWHKY